MEENKPLEEPRTEVENAAEEPVVTEENDAVCQEAQDEVKKESESEKDEIDYSLVMEEDLRELKALFPELSSCDSITSLPNPLRYATLRDLGLTAKEAYLATRGTRIDTRSHLFGAAPRAAGSPRSAISEGELKSARELFDGISDEEIRRLYRRVTT